MCQLVVVCSSLARAVKRRTPNVHVFTIITDAHTRLKLMLVVASNERERCKALILLGHVSGAAPI